MDQKVYICENCGKEFTEDWRKDKGARKTVPRFCSKECAKSFSSRKNLGKTKTIKCEVCGNLKEIPINSRSTICKECSFYMLKKSQLDKWTVEKLLYCKNTPCPALNFVNKYLFKPKVRNKRLVRKKHPRKLVIVKNNNISKKTCPVFFRVDALLQNKPICKYCNRISTTKQGIANHEKYCKNNPNREIKVGTPQTEETKKKLSKIAKQNHYGGYRKGSGRGKSGWYKGYWCDSSWELAYVIYNTDHGIPFERNKKGFKYEYENKIHTYYPDFIESGYYVEIKGMRSKQWDVKNQIQLDLPKKVLYEEEIAPYLNYAISTYGSNYIDLYQKSI